MKAKKPFFVRYLETQELKDVAGGRTVKYPSDNDEFYKSSTGSSEPVTVDRGAQNPSDG